MEVEVVQVDAFAAEPFKGNPAAVCFLPTSSGEHQRGWPSDQWLQHLAAEMNLSETAFLLPSSEGEAHYELRWLTPTVEVELCGHATLAAAHALFESKRVAPHLPIVFHTRKAGLLTVHKHQEWLQMDFPAEPPVAVPPAEVPAGLLPSLGLTEDQVVAVGRNRWDLFVEVRAAAQVVSLSPDLARLAAVTSRCAVVTARAEGPSPDSDSGVDFVSRVFAPAAGVNEDPVTGSAHCGLAPYWRQRLQKSSLRAFQASKRGGQLRLEVTDEGRVLISGQAVTVFHAHLRRPPNYDDASQ
ncbi:PhzF family phenazine biosynthesis protein [Acanthamoeba castellanii str. Neff]|uniref:PhzF family phenazine biosynthesis protein n=1 Tax=Acanthamoeba castellanii (strain ATCC 30010 / Neff) TaxID=1257118 RepID=L8GF94_ACACF|nr:PhzF family phenazine biosynthesis protein [Acanthamoeba castellanii str. Neff]ELR11750.1 PhzF family phenazine biosynthesis protein [Acanthamoeba castellanii str. Neff]